MAIEVKDKEIDGHKYTVTSFGGREGVKIKAKLIKYFGPSLLSLTTIGLQGKKKFSETEIDPELLSKLFQNLTDQLDEDEYLNFLLRLLKSTRYDNQEINEELFDTIFAGNYLTLYKVIFFVMEVNYKKSFFGEGGIGNLTERIKNLIPQENKSTKDSPTMYKAK